MVLSASEGTIFLRCHTSDLDPVAKEAHGKWIFFLMTLIASERIRFPRPNLDAAICKADVFIVKGGDWLPWVYKCTSKTLFLSLLVQGFVIAADVGCQLHWEWEPQHAGFTRGTYSPAASFPGSNAKQAYLL